MLLGCRRILHHHGVGLSFAFFIVELVINTVGRVFMVFFISVCVSVFAPFQCTTHPNGEISMQLYTDILCWKTGSHQVMVGSTIGLCSTCLLPYLSACIWATRRYPQAVILRSAQFLEAFRFLFTRSRPDCYLAGLVLLARRCMLSLVPIVVQT